MTDFTDIEKKNADNKKREEEERQRQNEKTLKSYRLKYGNEKPKKRKQTTGTLLSLVDKLKEKEESK